MSRYNKFQVDDEKDLSSDNVYVDIIVRNISDERRINAEYSETRVEAIVDNPSDYYLSLVRWSLPAYNLPLNIMPIQSGSSTDSEYSVTLEFNGDIQPINIQYISRNAVTPTTDQSSIYFWMFTYQHMVDLINTALDSAFSALAAPPIGSTAPYLIFNPESNLFSLIAQTTFYDLTLATPIKIWFNSKLYELFNGLPSNFPNEILQLDGRDAQILVNDYHNNLYNEPISAPVFPPLFYEIKQNFKSISTWTAVKQIIFETQLIPINSEYTSVSNNSFKKILTDFEPIKSSDQDVRTLLQYFPQGQYRLVDLVGTNPQYNIDLIASWLDIYGNVHKVSIPYLHQMTAKLLFVKRNLYKTLNKNYH